MQSDAARHTLPASSEQSTRLKTPVRAFGFFLLGLQAIGLILTSRQGPWDPMMIGIVIAALWSFPALWQRFPPTIRKILLVVLATVINAGLWRLLSAPGFWKFVAFLGMEKERDLGLIVMGSLLCMALTCVAILFPRKQSRITAQAAGDPPVQKPPERWSNVPSITYGDVGGMEREKNRIRSVVQNRLHPEQYYGVVQNGILLYGPQGTGKTFLAEATAGEFGINYLYVRPTELTERWVGAPESNVREMFVRAAAHRPVVLFIDELDSLGSARQEIGRNGDPGGAGRMYNAVTIQLIQSIDAYRNTPGLVIMAATNFLDAVDPALIRDGRFDVKERVDLPDEETIVQIFEAQLARKPHENFPLSPLAKRVPGVSAAKVKALVDRSAAIAAEERRKITTADIDRAIAESGGADRPLVQPVDWKDVVVSSEVEQELRTLIDVLNHKAIRHLDVEAPIGLLLVGPTGTGKTLLAHLIATQTRRSFYPITPADVLSAAIGGSVKKLQDIFARAREYSPSIVFLDEIDALLPRNYGQLQTHDVQLVEQALMEISKLDAAHSVFLVATTNHMEQIDPRVLRGGRFSEKIEIGMPDTAGYRRLLERYIGRGQLDASLTLEHLIEQFHEVSPADLEAICRAAKRRALRRLPKDGTELPPLEWDDFTEAAKRVQVHT